jgi:hypothetical protein
MKRILNNILISPWNFAYEMGRNYLSGGGGGVILYKPQAFVSVDICSQGDTFPAKN